MPNKRTLARQLALSLVGGAWSKDAIAERISFALKSAPVNPVQLAARLIWYFDDGRTPRLSHLTDVILNDNEFHKWTTGQKNSVVEISIGLDSWEMEKQPIGLLTFPLPPINTLADLGHWLGVTCDELDWFADCAGRQAYNNKTKLHHYHYIWRARKNRKPRLIEIPKARLKEMQRRVLSEILDRVPKHEAVHGFQRKRSRNTYVQQHLGQEVVVRMDLKDFFHSVRTSRVVALFHTLGYPWNVARYLTGICCHATSQSLAGRDFNALTWFEMNRLKSPHLPQGAPSSPSLANLCGWRMDVRLQALAQKMSLNYSRYADDLAFSGDKTLIRKFFYLQGMVGAIVGEEGFQLNHRKTRLMTASQRQLLAGVVVNVKPNIQRTEIDRLKATLYNCLVYGPESQNRRGYTNFRSHLQGKIADIHSLNPKRAAKLAGLFQKINWGC